MVGHLSPSAGLYWGQVTIQKVMSSVLVAVMSSYGGCPPVAVLLVWQLGHTHMHTQSPSPASREPLLLVCLQLPGALLASW